MEITNKDVMKSLFDFATNSNYLCLRHNALYCIEVIYIYFDLYYYIYKITNIK